MTTRRNYTTMLGLGMAGLVCAAGAHGQHEGTRFAASLVASAPLARHVGVGERGPGPVPMQFVPRDKARAAAPPFRQAGGVKRVGAATGRYFVTLKQPSVVEQLAQSRAKRGDAQPLSLRSAEASRHEAQLVTGQHAALASFERLLGRNITPRRSFTKALNGFSVQVSEREAALLATDDAVRSVLPVVAERVDTDAGPALIGAPAIWDGSATGVATLGEGITVGIIDTGINADHPSFAETSGGYVHENPFGAGVYRGWCAAPENAGFCNDKLIAAYDFVYDLTPDDPDYSEEPSPDDNNGHGSHTAGTAAGNAIEVSYHGLAGIAISGVAPHANIIAYDACYSYVSTGEAWCPGDATAAAVEQAIADGVVDVINFSIGGGDDPYDDFVSQAFLAATEMGIYIAASAGNDGPDAGTTGHQEPWVGTTAASTHGRVFGGTVAITGPGVPPEPLTDIVYVASSGVSVAAAIVSPLRDVAAIAPGDAEGCSAYPAGSLGGQIALVSRGSCNFTVKVAHAQAAGAAAVVVYNNVPGASFSMASLGDPSITIPAVMIEQADGLQLAAFAQSHAVATLSVGPMTRIDTLADMIADFSSRGPASTLGVLKPDLAAPGVDVLAAVADGNGLGTPGTELDLYSGTSMASPHHAGAVALLRALQPAWTPMQLKSALMLTARTAGLVKEDGVTPADAFDHGNGRVQVAKAANAGLVMDETTTAFIAADPDAGGDPRALNLASLYSDNCLGTINCIFVRRFTNPHATVATWNLSFEQPEGVTLSASSTGFTLQPGATASVTFTADATALAASDGFRFGAVILTEQSATFEPLHMNVAIAASNGTLPDVVSVTTARDAGAHTLQGLVVPAVTDLTFVPSGLVRGTRSVRVLAEDSNPGSPFDDLTDGAWYTLVEPSQFGVRLVAEILASEAVDLDLYVGQDLNDDGIPQADELVALSAGATALERVELRSLPADRNYWILVQSWIGSGNGTDAFTLSHAFVPLADAGNLSVDAPAVPQLGVPFDATLLFDEAQMSAGERWYGALDVGSDPQAAQVPDLGTIGVDVIRGDDAVVKTADVAAASPGDVVTYTITVAPNASPSALAYSIVDSLPAGMTLVPGSVVASTGAVADNGGTLAWTFSQAPVSYDYTVSDSQIDSACAVPFANRGAYTDLAAYGIAPNPALDGEGPFQLTLPNGGMPYYGSERQPTLYFTPNGVMSFDPASILAEGNGANQPIPLDALPNALLAPLWNDMVLDQQAGGGVTIVDLTDIDGNPMSTIVELDHLLLGSDPENSAIDLQVFIDTRLQADAPELVFAYANPVGDFAHVSLPRTIGIENGDGSMGIELEYNSGVPLVDGTAICFDLVPAGNVETLTYKATVDDFAGPAKLLTNTAVHDTDAPGSKAEASSWSVVAGLASADLVVSLADAPDPVAAGAQIVYSIGVANAGPDAADGVSLGVTLPSGLAYAGAVGAGWNCVDGTVVTCTFDGALANGASANLMLTVDVAPGVSGERTTTAAVAAATGDPLTANNFASATTVVDAAAASLFSDGFED